MVAQYAPAYATEVMSKRRAYNLAPVEPGSFGAFIRAFRDRHQLSQEDFAALVGDGMIASDVSQLERGKVEEPKIRRMIAIARALGMPVTQLYVEAGFPEFADGAALTGVGLSQDFIQRLNDEQRHDIMVFARAVAGDKAIAEGVSEVTARRIRNHAEWVASRGKSTKR